MVTNGIWGVWSDAEMRNVVWNIMEPDNPGVYENSILGMTAPLNTVHCEVQGNGSLKVIAKDLGPKRIHFLQ